MLFRRSARHRGVRVLEIGFLIFSLVQTPLPQPDYHNIRHHDAPGEVCEHHDHLLRWHPAAGSAEDVALLHWHWFLPLSESSDSLSNGPAPALHAHVPDWQGATWDDGPRIAPETTARWIVRPAPLPLTMAPLDHLDTGVTAVLGMGSHRGLAFSATFARRATLTSLLSRWNC